MIYSSRGFSKKTLPSQVRGNNGEPPGETSGNFAPHNVRLWGAVKEEKRGTVPPNDSVDRGAEAVNRKGFESRKEGCCLVPNKHPTCPPKNYYGRGYGKSD